MKEDILSEESNVLTGQEVGAGEGTEKNVSTRRAEKLKKVMRRVKSGWLFLAILLVWVGVMQYIVAEKYPVVMKVVGESEEISANAMSYGLDFGALPKGNSSVRFVTIDNKGNRDVYVKIYKWGGASKFIEIDRNNFVLEAGGSENLEFRLEVPSGVTEKQYKGKVIIFEIPKIL